MWSVCAVSVEDEQGWDLIEPAAFIDFGLMARRLRDPQAHGFDVVNG